MGVPKFYRWTSERYPCLSEVINESQIPEFDNLYLDMNGIIHNCSHPNDDDVTFRITQEEIFVNIFAYIENLYNLIRPQKVFFMAVDGVAPRAKMNQQRARRFMSARTAKQQLAQAIEKGTEMPGSDRFDSNCITPGTYFMTTLHERLSDWVNRKSASDPRWQGRRIILSGHDCPGEGEHKIMDFIREQRTHADYDPNTRHCMYGLDADLIMLGIVSHEPHFSLLREEVTFNTRPRKNEKAKKPQRTDSAVKQFHLLHLSLLREYLAWEFYGIKDSLPFEYDMERIVDDWILMGLLVGNDFLPHLPNIHIHDDALPLLYSTYKKVLPTLDGYINEGGYLNLGRFEKFLAQLAINDKDSFMEKLEDSEWLESKKISNQRGNEVEGDNDEELVDFESSDIENDDEDVENENTVEEEADPAFVSDHEDGDEDEDEDNDRTRDLDLSSVDNELLEGEFNDELATLALSAMNDEEFANNVEACWTRTINNQFKRHKKSYYSEKLRYTNISKSQLREQAEGYVRAIQWNLHYYYHGCVSWSWFYPHHYAPYISDVQGFSDMKMEFELSSPFRPFEQLLAVLPEASKDCLPRPLQELMTSDPTLSEISDFYPANFETDLNGKRNDWEAVVLIPFIDEKRLLAAIESKTSRLTTEEISRNSHGPHIQCVSSQNADGKWVSTRTTIDGDKFRIPREAVKWGLLPNVKMDVYFPGFPTMKHLKHIGELKFANCNVFGMASRKESMVLKVHNNAFEKDIVVLGSEYCDQEVCIDWPILKLAKVESIWGDNKIVRYCPGEEDIIVKDMSPEEEKQWASHVNHLQDQMMTRYAIEIAGKKDEKGKHVRPPIVWVRQFTGNVYESVMGPQGPSLKAVKQWSNEKSVKPVLLPLAVKDVLLENSRVLADLPINMAYPKQSVVWITDPKMAIYGLPGMVSGYQNEKSPNCRLEVVGMVTPKHVEKMKSLAKKQNDKSLRWQPGYDSARQCQVDPRLFARITGTMFLWNEPRAIVEKGQQISSESKINCGLSLKYSRRDLCVADYTDRIEITNQRGNTNLSWFYSNLTCRLVNEYKKKFPEVFRHLDSASFSSTEDVYYAEDIWPVESKRNERFAELKQFLESLASRDAEQLKCGTVYADRQLVAEVEAALDESVIEAKSKQPATMMKYMVPPTVVFRYELYDGKVHVDSEADFQLLDRVACMAPNIKLARTVLGTVVGIHDEKIDVLFDRAFEGGSHVRGSKKASAYRLPQSSLFNVTYGLTRKGAVSEEQKKLDLFDKAYVEIPPKKNDTKEQKNKKKDVPSTSSVSTTSAASASASTSTSSQQKNSKKSDKKKDKNKKPEDSEILAESISKLLKINTPSTSSKGTSEGKVVQGKPISLMEILGGGAAKKPIKLEDLEKAPQKKEKLSVLDQLNEAQKNSNKNKESQKQNEKKADIQKQEKSQNSKKKEKQEKEKPKKIQVLQRKPSEEEKASEEKKKKNEPHAVAAPAPAPPPPPKEEIKESIPLPNVSVPPPGFMPSYHPMAPGHMIHGPMGPVSLEHLQFQQMLNMQQMQQQMNAPRFAPQFDGKRANPTLTDFKPSSTTNRNHNRRNHTAPKVTMIVKPKQSSEEQEPAPEVEQPVKAPTTSTEHAEASEAPSETSQKAKKPRKKKQSRLAINFQN